VHALRLVFNQSGNVTSNRCTVLGFGRLELWIKASLRARYRGQWECVADHRNLTEVTDSGRRLCVHVLASVSHWLNLELPLAVQWQKVLSHASIDVMSDWQRKESELKSVFNSTHYIHELPGISYAAISMFFSLALIHSSLSGLLEVGLQQNSSGIVINKC
jgi:hypothetical protein